jgi:hypothetical protein
MSIGHCHRIVRALPALVLAVSYVPSGCACEDYLAPNVVVEVRDRDGRPAAEGVTGVAEHAGGAVTDLVGWDSLRVHGHWRRELPGRYTIQLRKPGFRMATARTEIDDGFCHVETRTIRMTLEPDPAATPQTPLRFLRGDEVSGFPIGTAARLLGDTLEIVGNSWIYCGGLKAVAVRPGAFMHVQLEPESWAAMRGPCTANRTQLFELRYHMTPGLTELLVTTVGHYSPVLFEGIVPPR